MGSRQQWLQFRGGTSGTCSGNGDGEIGSAGYEYESFRFWQHLYYAGMFNQRLSGVASSAGVDGATIGTNVPAGSIGGSGFSVVWVVPPAAMGVGTIYYPGSYGNVLIFGGGNNSFLTSGPLLTADQAASLDSKIDDGLPATGRVRSFTTATSSYTPNCATSMIASVATYNVTASGNLCSLIFTTNW